MFHVYSRVDNGRPTRTDHVQLQQSSHVSNPPSACHSRTRTQPRLKSRGGPRLGPNRARPKASLGVVDERGSPLPAVSVRGYHPRKISENSDAKSCILVTTGYEISCFLKTTAKKLGAITLLVPPILEVGGPVSHGPYGCCAYARTCQDLRPLET